MRPIVNINDVDFVTKMDDWYKSTNYRKEWDEPIPTYLPYFIRWCQLTTLSVEVNSTKFFGHYPYASVNFNQYVKEAQQLNFIHGYPISISNTEGYIMIYQRCFDDFLYYKVEDDLKNICFRYKGDDTTIWYPHDDYFRYAIKAELDNLFIPGSLNNINY